ncbi:UNVERIFIED_CONTAM: hypothetical protein Sangu_1005100 [Sesamum angustifolium]|uniref:GAG-pre-integrase domain-containing protein n=1 Tax=Sesamum angustifolium TaxID=2727405 RepID=A0AAW2PEY9_9LAMI
MLDTNITSENLLSVGKLVENGYGLWFKGNLCKIYNNIAEDKVIAKVKTESTRNFPLRLHHNSVMTESADDSWLWHKNYCHLNFPGPKLLKEKKMAKGLLEIKINANSIMLSLGHIRENLKELDKKFGHLVVNAQVARQIQRAHLNTVQIANFLVSIYIAME